jgi:hypothetical protein
MLRKIDTLLEANPELREVPLEIVDESKHRDFARRHDYFYVPAFYVDGEKQYEEGVLHADLEDIFRSAAERTSA